MNMSKFILIIFLISYCISDTCNDAFTTFIQNQCYGIDNRCRYFFTKGLCTAPKACSEGNVNTCSTIIPTNYNRYKCTWDRTTTTCKETEKLCSDYDPDMNDDCTSLQPKSGEGDRCKFSYSGKCTPHFDNCAGAPQAQCDDNIPYDTTKRCVWKANSCQTQDRLCNDNYILNPSDCTLLKSSNEHKHCYYLGGECIEYYDSCEDYEGNNKDECESIKPLRSDKLAFDETKNCTYDARATENKCKTKDIMCTDYIVEDERII